MINKTELNESYFIFKDNETYLDQTNWQNYFQTTLSNGFTNLPAYYDNISSPNKFQIKPFSSIFRGLWNYYRYGNTFDLVTQSEVDCLYYIRFERTENAIKICQATNISDNASEGISFLSNIMENMGESMDSVSSYLEEALYGSGSTGRIMPIAYALYGHGYWDLSRLINKSGESKLISENIGFLHDGTPLIGHIVTAGYVQIYGGHRYNLTLKDLSASGDLYLYPVPVCNLEPALIYIKNDSEYAITLKIPLSYRDMVFDYVRDGTWVENTGYLTYSVAADSDLVIKVTQTQQMRSLDNGTYYPKAVYEITQNVRNNDPGEGYSKAEANALFETQANVATALSSKVDTSDLGTLATKDSVDYETEVTNKPTYGSMAYVDDPDGVTIDTAYARKEGEWTLVPTVNYVNEAVSDKVKSSSIAEEYNVATDYEVGDLVMHEGQLYRYENNLEELTVSEVPTSGNIYSGSYYNNGSSLYQALANYSGQYGSTIAEAVDYLLENGKIALIPTKSLTPFAEYSIDDIAYNYHNTYHFYRLTAEYGLFTPVSMKELYYNKDEIDTALNEKLDNLTFDDVPTENSENPVTSDGIYNALEEKTDINVIAEDYDSSITYNIGDLCMKDGELNRYAHGKRQLSTQALTASGHASQNDYITYQAELYKVVAEVIWNEQTVELAYDFVTHNENVFIRTDYEIYVDSKTYETGDIVKIGSNFYSITEDEGFEVISIDDLISEKLSVASFLNAFGAVGSDVSEIEDALDQMNIELNNKASVQSPIFTGTPKAPTPATDDNSTKIATTAFVKDLINPFIQIPTFYVNGDSGSDSTGDGTQSAPFKTIGKAIEKTPNGGYSTIIILPYVYDEFLNVTGKKIKIIGTVNSTITIDGSDSNHAGIILNRGGLVILEGDFRIKGRSSAIQVADSSSLIYEKINQNDKLVVRATTTTATSHVISVLDGSSFIVKEIPTTPGVYLEISAADNYLTNAGIRATNGSFVSVPVVTMDINVPLHGSRGVEAWGSIVTIRQMSGDYEIPVINDRSFVNIPGIEAPAPTLSPVFTGTPTAPTPVTGSNSDQIATTAFVSTSIAGKAPLASPTFTGTPKAPTPATGTNTTQLATTAFVQDALDHYVPDPDLSALAPKDSPAFTGTPTAPTPSTGTNNTQLATTAFVQDALDHYVPDPDLSALAPKDSPVFTGTPTAPTPDQNDVSEKLATTRYVDIRTENALTNTVLRGWATTQATPDTGDNSKKVANTEYVTNYCEAYFGTNIANMFINSVLNGRPTRSLQPFYDKTEDITSNEIPTLKYVHEAIDDYLEDTHLRGDPTTTNVSPASYGNRIASTKFVVDKIDSKLEDAFINPVFTGTPKCPNPLGDRTTQIANTQWVSSKIDALNIGLLAPKASPSLTGAPTAPTQETTDNSAKISTTAFVKNAIYSSFYSPDFRGAPRAETPMATDKSTRLATTQFVYDAFARVASTNLNLYVNNVTGNDTTGTGTEANPYRTVQKAISASGFGITNIYISAGSYQGDVEILAPKRVILRSAGNGAVTFENGLLVTGYLEFNVGRWRIDEEIKVINGGVIYTGGDATIDGIQKTINIYGGLFVGYGSSFTSNSGHLYFYSGNVTATGGRIHFAQSPKVQASGIRLTSNSGLITYGTATGNSFVHATQNGGIISTGSGHILS